MTGCLPERRAGRSQEGLTAVHKLVCAVDSTLSRGGVGPRGGGGMVSEILDVQSPGGWASLTGPMKQKQELVRLRDLSHITRVHSAVSLHQLVNRLVQPCLPCIRLFEGQEDFLQQSETSQTHSARFPALGPYQNPLLFSETHIPTASEAAMSIPEPARGVRTAACTAPGCAGGAGSCSRPAFPKVPVSVCIPIWGLGVF